MGLETTSEPTGGAAVQVRLAMHAILWIIAIALPLAAGAQSTCGGRDLGDRESVLVDGYFCSLETGSSAECEGDTFSAYQPAAVFYYTAPSEGVYRIDVRARLVTSPSRRFGLAVTDAGGGQQSRGCQHSLTDDSRGPKLETALHAGQRIAIRVDGSSLYFDLNVAKVADLGPFMVDSRDAGVVYLPAGELLIAGRRSAVTSLSSVYRSFPLLRVRNHEGLWSEHFLPIDTQAGEYTPYPLGVAVALVADPAARAHFLWADESRLTHWIWDHGSLRRADRVALPRCPEPFDSFGEFAAVSDAGGALHVAYQCSYRPYLGAPSRSRTYYGSNGFACQIVPTPDAGRGRPVSNSDSSMFTSNGDAPSTGLGTGAPSRRISRIAHPSDLACKAGSNHEGAWRFEEVDPSELADLHGPRPCPFLEPSGIDIAADQQGSVHIVYRDAGEVCDDEGCSPFSRLLYASNRGGSWQSEVAAAPADGTADAGLTFSIAIGNDDQPAIAATYVERETTGSPRYAQLRYYRRGTNGAWSSQVVADRADGFVGTDGTKFTGYSPRLRFDGSSRPHILFSDYASSHFKAFRVGALEFPGQLRHAYHNGQRWLIGTIYPQRDPLSRGMYFSGLALSPAELAYVGVESTFRIEPKADEAWPLCPPELAAEPYSPEDFHTVIGALPCPGDGCGPTYTPIPTITSTPPPPSPTLTATATSTLMRNPTPTPTPGLCVGDCNRDGTLTIAELASGIAQALSDSASPPCDTFDANDDSHVTIEELIVARNAAVYRCRRQVFLQ